jgi:hypothetical protein
MILGFRLMEHNIVYRGEFARYWCYSNKGIRAIRVTQEGATLAR